MENSQYCVLWNNYHDLLVDTIGYLQRDGQLTDITIVCYDGNKVDAHQLVLAACSTFFRDFLHGQGISSIKHPIVLLPSDIKFDELESMVEFMYTGQVCIQQEKLQSFIRGAKYLKIKGLDDPADESDIEEQVSDNEKVTSKESSLHKRKFEFESYKDVEESIAMTTIKGKKVKDHRYTQQLDLGNSEDNDKWEVIDRKPIIFPPSNSGRKRYRKKAVGLRKQPLHLSNNIVCFERKNSPDKEEPINKVRKHTGGHLHGEDLDLCTCTARKIWAVDDTAALLHAWNETLDQVPPSYFIRSVSLCKSVAKRLQRKGVQKNWRQCQVKMKNLRREVKLYKLSTLDKRQHSTSRKGSEVANICEKLLPSIEDIFSKEQSIRKEWYDKKEKNADNVEVTDSTDLLAHVAVLADSDLGDDDTDGVVNETECDDGFSGSHNPMLTVPHGTVVHHIVEPLTVLAVTKEEPLSGADTDL